MVQVFIASAVVAVAVVVGLVLRRRQQVAAPTQVHQGLTAQLERADVAATQPWLVVVFSSASCHTCADVVRKAGVLESDEVGVVDVEFTANRQLHLKYRIDAVPIVVVADAQGVVHAGFVGLVTATDLWAAVAEARLPGSSPEPELGQ